MSTPACSPPQVSSPPGAREASVTEIRAELRALLDSREFRQSKGLSKLLRYLCGKALVGDPEPITGYTIARDVFGKPEDFKDNNDASVRVEVHRLRKRLGEFYTRQGASSRVRIVIPSGRYAPEFLILGEPEPDEPSTEMEVAAQPLQTPEDIPTLKTVSDSSPLSIPPVSPAPSWLVRNRFSAAVALLLLGLTGWGLSRPAEPIDGLWRPVLRSPGPVLLCIGDMSGGRPFGSAQDEEKLTLLGFHFLRSQNVLLNDAAAMTRFAGLLQSKGKAYRVVSQSEATFNDLQNGPTVLIGLANNSWNERLVGTLRFWLQRSEPGSRFIIRDRQHPDRADWNLDFAQPMLQVTKDYALVLRVLDPKTGQTVISAAGISAFGTLAAGDFLTRPEEFRKVEAVAPRGWQRMNFELVLSTEVIRGKSGPANIVAWHFW